MFTRGGGAVVCTMNLCRDVEELIFFLESSSSLAIGRIVEKFNVPTAHLFLVVLQSLQSIGMRRKERIRTATVHVLVVVNNFAVDRL